MATNYGLLLEGSRSLCRKVWMSGPGTRFGLCMLLLISLWWYLRQPSQGRQSEPQKSSANVRIRSVPQNITINDLRSRLKKLGNTAEQYNVVVYSLETSPSDASTQVATVRIQSLPSNLSSLAEKKFQSSIDIELPDLLGKPGPKVSLDSSCLGMTPLSCPENAEIDIIAVTGLGGHALKSWGKPDRQDIWLRDFLPGNFLQDDVPKARILTYGYDTLVNKSNSKSSIVDLAIGFLEALKNCRNRPEEEKRPIIFIGHSLGGLVIKEALAYASESVSEDNAKVLISSYGLLFFGVPNKGLNYSGIMSIVDRQPNENLVRDILVDKSNEPSSYLKSLHNRFESRVYDDTKIIAFYETRHSFTIIEDPPGSLKFTRSGPRELIVTRDSAINISRVQQPSVDIAMARDHSDLVKFVDQHDDEYITVKRNIFKIAREAPAAVKQRFLAYEASGSRSVRHQSYTTAQPNFSSFASALASTKDQVFNHDGDSDELADRKEAVEIVNTVTMIRNYAFVGRDDILEEINTFLRPPDSSELSGPSCCVIHGLGGQGKSQTALEYAYRYRRHYDALFWLNAEIDHELTRSYALIAQKLGLTSEKLTSGTSQPTQDSARDIKNARDWLENTRQRWLLIFDNLENKDDLMTYLPNTLNCNGAIIITTQLTHLTPVTARFHKIALQPLEELMGARLLFKALSRKPLDEKEEHLVRDISKWVGGLPLALATIGGYIIVSQSSPEEVFERLQRSSRVWASSGQGAVTNYKKTLATVFNLALSELKPNTRHLLDIMAFLNPDSIPEEMLQCKQDNEPLKFLNDKDEFLDIVLNLGSRQLIKRSLAPSGCLSIHRSLQRNILYFMHEDPDTSKRQRVFEEVYSIIRKVLPEASLRLDSEPDVWPIFSKYVPQVVSLREHSTWPDPPLKLGLHVSNMLCDVGTYLWHTGQFHDCNAALNTAEEIVNTQSKEVQSSSECKVLLNKIFNFTGILCDCVGVSRRHDSLRIRQACVELCKEVHDAILPSEVTVDHKIRLQAANADLGCAYMQRGEFDRSGIIFDNIFEECKTWGSEEDYPYEYAKYYHYSAFVRMAQGDPDLAIAWCEKSEVLMLQHAKQVDDMVLIYRYDLASLLYNAGKEERSLKLHEEILKDRLQLSGPASQYTLECYESCGTLYYFTGNLSKAEEYLCRCLDWHYRARWTKEGVARAQFRLSQVLRAKGDLIGAEEEAKAAYKIRDEFLELYPEFLTPDPTDESAVFDQMLHIWVSQFTGKLQVGGRKGKASAI